MTSLAGGEFSRGDFESGPLCAVQTLVQRRCRTFFCRSLDRSI